MVLLRGLAELVVTGHAIPLNSAAADDRLVIFKSNRRPHLVGVVPSERQVVTAAYCRHFSKDPSTELLGFGCLTSALSVAKAKPFVSHLLPQNPILLLGIVNDVALVLA